MSVEEYLRLEDAATEKHEYRNGYRYVRHAGPYGFEAMAGAREPHARMAMRVARLLDEHLDDSPCVVYGTDMRLATDDDAYFYPDVFVTWNPRTGPDILAQHDATMVVEILSPGTEVTIVATSSTSTCPTLRNTFCSPWTSHTPTFSGAAMRAVDHAPGEGSGRAGAGEPGISCAYGAAMPRYWPHHRSRSCLSTSR
jgi:hypothetical protein